MVCVDRLSGAYAEGHGSDAAALLEELPDVTVVQADLAADPVPPLVAAADGIVHLAGLPGVRTGHGAEALFEHNVLATARILEALEPRQRLVFASTSSIYGDAAVIPTPEDWPAGPLNSYARSKLAAEHACLAAAARGTDVVIARLFTVYGPGQRPDMAFARWIDSVRDDRPLAWCARSRAQRDFTFVEDAVAGLMAALERGRRGAAYNIAGTGPEPVERALELIEELLETPARVVALRSPAAESRITAACLRRAACELGYAPSVPLEEGLRRQVEVALRPPAVPAGA